MIQFPSPHGDKLRSLLRNKKLPVDDRPLVEEAIARYETWLYKLQNVQGTNQEVVSQMVHLLNEYKLFLDIDGSLIQLRVENDTGFCLWNIWKNILFQQICFSDF